MLLIDNEVVRRVLSMDECIRVQEEAFRGLITGDSIHRPRIDVYIPCDRPDGYYRWGTMEGGNKSLGVFAIRMKSDVVHWPKDEKSCQTEEKYCVRPGLYCGLVFLFSTRNGEPLAIMNDGHLQHMRVGGGAGIGAKYLSRPDAKVVAMIGSGGMARAFLEAFLGVREIRTVKVYSPTPAHRKAYAEEMGRRFGVDVQSVADPRSAIKGADIVATCTDSIAPVLEDEWLEPGMHVTSVSANSELDEDVYNRADVVIRQGDSGWLPSEQKERLQVGRRTPGAAYIAGSAEEMARIPPPNPIAYKRGKYPTFMDLVSGKARGRESETDITLYIPGGNQGLQFAAVGWLIYRKARELGLGRELPTEWFLQDIRD